MSKGGSCRTITTSKSFSTLRFGVTCEGRPNSPSNVSFRTRGPQHGGLESKAVGREDEHIVPAPRRLESEKKRGVRSDIEPRQSIHLDADPQA